MNEFHLAAFPSGEYDTAREAAKSIISRYQHYLDEGFRDDGRAWIGRMVYVRERGEFEIRSHPGGQRYSRLVGILDDIAAVEFVLLFGLYEPIYLGGTDSFVFE